MVAYGEISFNQFLKKKMEFGAKALINLSTHLFMQYS